MTDSGDTPYTAEQLAQVNRVYRAKALRGLRTPAHVIYLDYDVDTVRSGDEVLVREGISPQQAVEEPWRLLSGDAYNGGSTMAMDPFHPATAPLNELRFAVTHAVEHQDEATMEVAAQRAGAQLAKHGPPPEINLVCAVGHRAQAFSAMDILALMPNLELPHTWQDRADATYALMGALAGMPADNPARPAVEEYVAMLATPGVPPGFMTVYEVSVCDALMAWGKTHERSGWGIDERPGWSDGGQ